MIPRPQTAWRCPSWPRYLGFFPEINEQVPEDGIFVARNYGERIAVRGGKAGSLDRAGSERAALLQSAH